MAALELIFWLACATIAYAYVGFPLLLALLARFQGKKQETEATQPDPGELPRVVMVVAAFNEAAVLPEKLANTWALDYPADRFKLLIGSDGSDDGSAAFLAGQKEDRLEARLFPERRGKISVLNDLMREVDADVVVLSDANTIFAPDAIRKLVAPFRQPWVGCVSGELHLEQEGGVSGEGLYWKYEGWIKRNESRLGFLIGCNGGIFALRPHLYEPLPPSTIVEDFVLSMRVLERGSQVVFEPEARASEPPCPSARAEMIRKIRIGAGGYQALALTYRLLFPTRGRIAFAYWGHKVLRWLVPVLLLTTLASSAALAAQPLYAGLLALQLVGVGVALAAHRQRPGLAPPRWARPISYFYLMNYALFCGLLRFLFRTQRVTWDRASR